MVVELIRFWQPRLWRETGSPMTMESRMSLVKSPMAREARLRYTIWYGFTRNFVKMANNNGNTAKTAARQQMTNICRNLAATNKEPSFQMRLKNDDAAKKTNNQLVVANALERRNISSLKLFITTYAGRITSTFGLRK